MAEAAVTEHARKTPKTRAAPFASRVVPVRSGPASLQAQAASLERETSAFLHKRRSDVDVVCVPESVPTANHSVVSLAELYYLTQTLPLTKLLPGTHKTLLTENFELALLEGKVAVLFSRIEELKRLRKWLLRQPVRYYDPFVYARRNRKGRLLAWDYVLQEGRWMAADFREAAKYKKLCCVTMAQAVRDFWAYGRVVGPFKAHVDVHQMHRLDQAIVRSLPRFSAFADADDSRKPVRTGESSLVPVSRMLCPMERDDEWHKIVLRDSRRSSRAPAPAQGLPEFQKGLFGVQLHRRLNFLRPPKPPLVKNIEFRSPTIWLPQDDKLLIHYVAEYCFNWDLIAENIPSHAATLRRCESNIERRTPWQCFERYVQLNEKFQFSDMKGINAYLAQQWLEHAHKAQLTTKRRISPLGVGNESIQRGHRRLRWASMFDAMRKTMRKRETAAAKASSRRSTTALPDPAAPGLGLDRPPKRAPDRIPTPAELSRLKVDRDKSLQEAYVHQQATRSKMMAAAGRPGSQQRAAGTLPGLAPQSKQPAPSFKRPTTPNGTPLTVEQIQRLLQIQKQRRLIQQQGQPAVSAGTRADVPLRGRIQFPPAQVSAIINSIQQKNPNLSKDQVTKLAALYLANLQQQQQSKLEQQAARAATAGDSAAAQQSLQARQAQLSRQRLAAQASVGLVGKEPDAQTLSKMQYEERKKLMMQQGGAQYGQGAVPRKSAGAPLHGSKGPKKPGSRG
ncbi:hypothetical protein METBIDRAFT_40022 [Metschnikowia bicuspidata var. bicuspidata NRRL YB-4993]|uniref:Chromatin modification-related protein EAF1 n=1 Tax=Metschnikowia bicuspidata var. bicuspidata NRRL YB-4993 TaxID=869754 RepID=A0A1A0HEH6_9ASCO|nr:hypothetical protein METBIDRAFT_40022 [Metschnikowia bicuspidata var. bicuspidata NRRL YB-4993]OBA22396.1 hypothetical protein METBIDRAFT_40022 [Metschnikowia bicuspidata var. bicuspidata NRRL YB-4993]